MKGKWHSLFCDHDECAPRNFRHLPAMRIKTTLQATAPLLYLCRRYPKCPWGLCASPPPVAMAVVGWFLRFPALFFGKKGVFFHMRQKTKFTQLIQKKFRQTKKCDLRQKGKNYATYGKKKKASYAYFHNQATLSSYPHGATVPLPQQVPPKRYRHIDEEHKHKQRWDSHTWLT